MKVTTPKYYNKFKCIADKCEDTCCKGWEIVIDKNTLKKYKNNKSDFAKILNSKIILYEDNEPGFRLEGNRCPFLNENNLCDIYINLGEDNLCNTCKLFPRVIEQYGNIKEISLSLGCPESARILLGQKDKITFQTLENDESITDYNSLSFEMLSQIISARNIAMSIIRNRKISLSNRIFLYLSFSREIQDCIDKFEISKITEVKEKFKDERYLNELLNKANEFKPKEHKKYETVKQYLDLFKQLESINNTWLNELQKTYDTLYKNYNLEYLVNIHKCFFKYYKEKIYEYENIMMYFVFRYFMKSLNDCNLLPKVILAIFSLIIIIELDVSTWISNNKVLEFKDQVYIVHLFSKEVEHSEDNIIKLYELFESEDIFSLENIINVILN